MRIACETEMGQVPFSELEPGDVFKLHEWYYIKLTKTVDCQFEAVDLEEGVLACVSSSTLVTPKPHCRLIFD